MKECGLQVNNLNSNIKTEYERWLAKCIEDPYETGQTVSIQKVLKAHYLLADFFSKSDGNEHHGVFGPRDETLLHSALARQFTGYGSISKWKSPLEICATLFFGLIKNHPFHDGNKRTALLTLLYHLDKIHRTVNAQQKEFERLTIEVAANQLVKYPVYNKFKKKDAEVLTIAWFLKRTTRASDKRHYGCDSTVLFHGADPLRTLISTYENTLRRLPDK